MEAKPRMVILSSIIEESCPLGAAFLLIIFKFLYYDLGGFSIDLFSFLNPIFLLIILKLVGPFFIDTAILFITYVLNLIAYRIIFGSYFSYKISLGIIGEFLKRISILIIFVNTLAKECIFIVFFFLN